MKIICAVGEVSNVFLFFFFLGKLWKLKNHRQCILVWLVLDLGLTLWKYHQEILGGNAEVTRSTRVRLIFDSCLTQVRLAFNSCSTRGQLVVDLLSTRGWLVFTFNHSACLDPETWIFTTNPDPSAISFIIHLR